MKQQVTRFILLASMALLNACSQDDNQRSLSPEVANLPTPATLPDAGAFARHLPRQAFKHLSIAVSEAEALNSSIEDLMTTSNDVTLHRVKKHWRLSYDAYLTAFASSRLPVTEPPEWQAARLTSSHLTEQLNSWPIEPGYIDYLDGYPLTGIVNDTTLTLNAENITNQHKFSDASYISLGYPALEFILWGESGVRPASDFDHSADQAPKTRTPQVTASTADIYTAQTHTHTGANQDDTQVASIVTSSVVNQARRGEYLRIVSQLLLEQLQRLQLRWEPTSGYYANKVSGIVPEKILQASLITAQQLLKDDLLGHYLTDEGSSTFSAGNSADLAALISGMRELFLPQDPHIGLAPLLAQSEHTVKNINNSSNQTKIIAENNRDAALPPSPLTRLRAGLAENSACGTGWQSAESHTAGRQACRQQLLELLAIFEEISTQLGMRLNASH